MVLGFEPRALHMVDTVLSYTASPTYIMEFKLFLRNFSFQLHKFKRKIIRK